MTGKTPQVFRVLWVEKVTVRRDVVATTAAEAVRIAKENPQDPAVRGPATRHAYVSVRRRPQEEL